MEKTEAQRSFAMFVKFPGRYNVKNIIQYADSSPLLIH